MWCLRPHGWLSASDQPARLPSDISIVFSTYFSVALLPNNSKMGSEMAHAIGNEKRTTNQKRDVLLVLLAFGLMAGSEALAHGGGLNSEGCHNNRKTGDYHCHRAQPVSAPMPAQLAANEPSKTHQLVTEPRTQQVPTNKAAGATCYTGPRGGTYTITASGRKNYSGC